MAGVDVIVNSMVYGGLVSLLALGLTLTYITLKLPNFAHADLASIGTYSTALFTGLKFMPLPYAAYALLPAAFLIGGLSALVTYYLIFKPLANRGASLTVMMIASLALSIVIRGILYVIVDVSRLYKTNLYDLFWKPFDVNIFGLPSIFYSTTALVIVLVSSLYFLMTKTKLGTSMRAAIENPSLALSLGINVERVYSIAWFLAGGLAALAGALLPLYLFVATPDTGYSLLLSIFAASVLGGLGSIYGAILGGYIIGFAEELGTQVLTQTISFPPNLRAAIPFIIIIVTLLLAPKGLTGLRIPRRKKA